MAGSFTFSPPAIFRNTSSQDHEGMSGVAIASAIEGVRPFLIETQALVSSAYLKKEWH